MNENSRKQLLGNVRRVVIKIGSSVLTNLPVARIRALAMDIALLRESGVEVLLISSGSINMGMSKLDIKRRPSAIPLLQAVASVGQVAMAGAYQDALGAFNIPVAQVLLTHHDLDEPARFLRARHTLMALLDYGVVPLINENDSVAIAEILRSDNDLLAARLPRLVEADLLVMLTLAEGLYAASTRKGGAVIPVVHDIKTLAQRVNEGISKGKVQRSLASKVQAAELAAADGVPTLVASGLRPGVLTNLLDNDTTGTLLLPSTLRRNRKKWIAEDLKPRGSIQVSADAYRSLVYKNRSLQTLGVTAAAGTFRVGDVVQVLDANKVEFARGLVGYDAKVLSRLQGKEPPEIEKLTGTKHYEEVIHRNDLVIL